MGCLNSYALLMPVPALLQIVSINLCHNGMRKQTSRTKIYTKPRERRYYFSSNQHSGIL